jgi:hypothetical protein
MGHLVKLYYKRQIRVLHLTVHGLLFGGRNTKKTSMLEPTISSITIQCYTIVPYYLTIKNLRKNVALHDKYKNYSLKTKLGAVLRPNS